MFNRGHALPLDLTRLLRPRMSRGRHAERPREISVPWPEPWHVHDRSPVGNSPRTRFILVRADAFWFPYCGQHVSRSVSDPFSPYPPMSSFDPTTVRKAVEEFTPSRPQKFQDLFPAKDVIAELRQKRASYRAIAELLTKHCLLTGKTAIAVFAEAARTFQQQTTAVLEVRLRAVLKQPTQLVSQLFSSAV